MDDYKVGDLATDPDGTEWMVVGVASYGGSQSVSRVKVGSLAHQVMQRTDVRLRPGYVPSKWDDDEQAA